LRELLNAASGVADDLLREEGIASAAGTGTTKESYPSDLVFRLDWLKNPEIAPKGIELLQTWVQKNSEFCSEADTRPVVEAMLRGLGWDTLTGDVAREGVPELGDYHLYYDNKVEGYRKICALIEAKRLHCDVKELQAGPLGQLSGYVRELATSSDTWILKNRSYCDGETFVYGVLTNGQLWWIYDKLKVTGDTPPSAYSQARRFDLLKDDDLRDLPSVLGKEQVCAEVKKFLETQTSFR
jgi:hypothetical protein